MLTLFVKNVPSIEDGPDNRLVDFQTPSSRFGYKSFFCARSLILLLLPLVITFLPSIVILFSPR
jgi:hypothetical protein